MGMYDEIKCEYPLPDPEAQGFTFQTKDLACVMEHFTITKEGRLIGDGANVWAQDDGGRAEEQDYTGVIRFYEDRGVTAGGRLVPVYGRDARGSFTREPGDLSKLYIIESVRWYEYQACFIDGQLQWLRRAPSTD